MAPTLDLTLSVNGEQETTVALDEPIVLTVSLSSHEAILLANDRIRRGDLTRGRGRSISVGRRGSDWAHHLNIYEMVGERQPRLITAKLLAHPAPTETTRIDASTVAVADFGIDAARQARLGPGRHTLRARFSGLGVPKSTTLSSNDLIVRVTRRAISRTRAAATSLAYYAYRKRDYKGAAIRLGATHLTEQQDIDHLILSGDVAIAQKRYADGLAFYQRAYAEFRQQRPNSYEQPRSLLTKISEAEYQLGKGKSMRPA